MDKTLHRPAGSPAHCFKPPANRRGAAHRPLVGAVATARRGHAATAHAQPGSEAQSNAISFADDWLSRLRPDLCTELLADCVPAVRRSGFHFVEVGHGRCSARLPLTRENTNQHGTHQALIAAMAADYTGGLALASLIRGVPVAGVHPVSCDDAMLLWLVNADLRYQSPSSEDLFAHCSVPVERIDDIRRRFWSGKTQIVPLQVELRGADGSRVAIATMSYYMKHSAHLRAGTDDKSAGVMLQHMRKSSARLIANVRGRQAEGSRPLYHDRFSRDIAGRHGEVLGERFLEVLPELGPMVAARTRHADDAVREALERGTRQLAIVGSGLDMRPFRFAGDAPGVTWFELDLPEMLSERERVLRRHSLPAVRRIGVPVDLKHDDPHAVLTATAGFDPDAPLLVIFEGCSMYFDSQEIVPILARLASLVRHRDSRLWLDLVAPAVIDGRGAGADVGAFVERMARIGEAFRFGHDDPAALFAPLGLRTERCEHSDIFAPASNALFRLYRFALLAPAAALPGDRRS